MAGVSDEEQQQLRGLVARGDGAALVELLQARPWPADSLQLIGDGLRAAVRDRVDAGAEVARDCLSRLQERAWIGDADLAEALAAALGDGPVPMLRMLPVDLGQLADVLEGDPIEGGGRIDLRNGEVWPHLAFADGDPDDDDEDEDEDEDPERWLWVDCEGSREGYRDMELFVERLGDGPVADRVARALYGPRPFRRFKDRLADEPELLAQWFAFSHDRQRGRARRWLADEGYAPA